MNKVSVNYRIYSINRPGCLLNFWALREALIRGWALIKFSSFSASVVCLFCNKTIYGNDKKGRCNKASEGSLIIYYLSLCWKEWGGSGRLLEAGSLLTFSAFRMGAYSRWALSRINTVYVHVARVAKSSCTIKKMAFTFCLITVHDMTTRFRL